MTPFSQWSIKDRILGVIMVTCYVYGFTVLIFLR